MTHYRIIDEIRSRIKWLDSAIEDYNKRITMARVEKNFGALDKYDEYKREAIVERDILVDMLRGVGIKVYLE